MALQSITELNIDFYDKKYIVINAKQLDRDSRYLSITCYNHGELYHLNNTEHAAYIRYRKADDYGVFNNCTINNKGKIIVNLTEQMLASDGICYADLVIFNKGDADIDPNTGKINENIENASVLSTMTFCIDVSEVPVGNSDIESTYEFTLLNESLEKYWAKFEDVVLTSKSWAVGDTGIDDRPDENTNNAMYYANQASSSLSKANVSAMHAADSEQLAESYMMSALNYKNTIENIVNGLETGFIPMGTITFAELATAERATGYVYNISDDFVTTSDFREGQGKSYTAGTNVYYTANGVWDCFGGASSPTATVDEVKEYLGI